MSLFLLVLLQLFALIASEDKSSNNSITFKVCDKIPEKYNIHDENSNGYSHSDLHHTVNIVSELNQYTKNNCTEYLFGTTFSSRSHASENNGFVNTVVDSYNGHHNLIIRPDDVWLQIMVQLSFYINANAEEFRSMFVDFEGKKDLIVSLPGSLRAAPYDMFIKLMSEKIHENILDKQFKNWILPNFTTTTHEDEVTSGVVFMATMKKYFSYGFQLACGIPSITLEGTVEDWLDILSRLEKLKSYKLEKWYDLLEPILQQFVQAKRGNPDLNFWNRMVHYQSGGSGSPTVSGWITTFCVFDYQGKWQARFHDQDRYSYHPGYKDFYSQYAPWPVLDSDNIPSGIAEVDVTIIDIDRNYSSVLFGGHMAFEVLDDEKTLKPLVGWALALKDTNNSDVSKPAVEIKDKQNSMDEPLRDSRPEHLNLNCSELDEDCQSATSCNPEVEWCDPTIGENKIVAASSCSICITQLFVLMFSTCMILFRNYFEL